MSKRISVLVVDDSEDDTLLLIDELRDNGFDPSYLRVDTLKAMSDALREQKWDIIIADYTMPQFSGPAALRALKDSGLDIPLILVSGIAEEHAGVDMMRAGAQDFIAKHNLSRLAPAVARELDEADVRRQRNKAEEIAKASSENYRLIFEYAPVAIVAYDRSGTILQVNPAFEHLYGYTAEEAVGRQVFDMLGHPESAEEITSRIFACEAIRNAEWKGVTKNGAPIYVLANITPVCDEKGRITMALSMIADITERKLAEERERETEAKMHEFYRRTILAATNGKLLISEKKDFDDICCPIRSWSVSSKSELVVMRDEVRQIAWEQGMDESRIYDFIGCVVEASGNAIKHAGGGKASLLKNDDTLTFMISDTGPGIQALAFPDVALVKGYSTAGTLGMGYKIMIQFADKVYLSTGPEGTTVAVEMGLHPPQPQSDVLLNKLTSKLSGEIQR